MKPFIGRVFLLLVIGVLFNLQSLWAASFKPAETPPHMIIMLADDLGWGDVGFHGSQIKTPHIDELASQGVQLNQFYVQPVCSPTRAALMTGRYPMRYGLQTGVIRPWAEHGLPLDETLLPQVLHENGYKTAICGKWHLGHLSPEYLPTHRGFDLQYGHYNGALDYFSHIRDGGHDWHKNDRANHDQGYTTELIAEQASQIIKTHDPTQPLFLYVPFNAPHTPLQAPKEDIALYQTMKNKQRRIYAAMVTNMDRGVGLIMESLHSSQLDPENTIILFFSDNGGIPKLGSNNELRSGKGTLYEGGVRVPAVMVWNEVLQPGKVIDEPMHVVDLFPTFLNLSGSPMRTDQPLDGKNVWPVIQHGEPSPHEYILHNITPFHGAIRMGDWKLIHNGHASANVTEKKGQETWELFNLRDDISEQNELSGTNPDQLARLKAKLKALEQEAAPAMIPPNRPPAGFQVPKVWGEIE